MLISDIENRAFTENLLLLDRIWFKDHNISRVAQLVEHHAGSSLLVALYHGGAGSNPVVAEHFLGILCNGQQQID